MNAKLQVSGTYGILLSYEYDSVVDQNIKNLDKMTEIYNELTKSNKKIAIISDSNWKKLKKEYVSNIKNGKKYDIIEEPELDYFSQNSHGEENPIDMFRDIIEIK